MNKLINDYNRGFSLKNDDLRFVDAAVRLALSDIIKSMGISTSRIMWGCEVTEHGTYISITEGAIFWNNEIWHVYAHNVIVAIPLAVPIYWAFVGENDPAGVKLDKDLVSHDAYQIRKAIASLVAAPAGVIGSLPWSDVVPVDITDITAPTAPSGLTGYAFAGGTARLDWIASTDGLGIEGYEIWAKKEALSTYHLVGTSAANTFLSSPGNVLMANFNYHFYVVAYDAKGNRSAPSTVILVPMWIA